MKPQNLIALLLFIVGAVWALTRSERSVRNIQSTYYTAISPFLKGGAAIETKASEFIQVGVDHLTVKAFQGDEGSFFVRAHHTAISDDIGCDDGSQSAVLARQTNSSF